MGKFKDHFSSRASEYAAYRPVYPPELAEYLASCTQRHELALDCGCGTGQLSYLLASSFKRVVATDASAQQIERAMRHPNVQYKHALAEESGLPDGSVDLVSVAQAAHWFDLDPFYEEVRRILRPAGVIALITYGAIEVDGEIGNLLSDLHYNVLDRFWPHGRGHVEAGYSTLHFPFREVASPSITMRASWTADQLLGYVNTWSALRYAEKELGRKIIGPYLKFNDNLMRAWGGSEIRHEMRWPIKMRVGYV